MLYYLLARVTEYWSGKVNPAQAAKLRLTNMSKNGLWLGGVVHKLAGNFIMSRKIVNRTESIIIRLSLMKVI